MIGLTGGIASGKSTVTKRLHELGAFVADADAVARDIVEKPEVLNRIAETFGAEIITKDGRLDRGKLSELVFASDDGVNRLNAITHPAIIAELLSLAKNAEASGEYPLVFIDAPLLIESGLNEYCQEVWLITADRERRIERIIERDGSTREAAEMRISRQMTDEEKAAFADAIIENDGELSELISRVDEEFGNRVFEDRENYADEE